MRLNKVLINIPKTEVALLLASQGSQYLSSFAIIKILASNYSVENFGLYNLVLTACFVLSMFPFTAFDQILNREITMNEGAKKGLGTYFTGYGLLLIITHVIFLTCLFLLPKRLSDVIGVIILFSITNIIKTTSLGTLNFTGNRKGFNLLKIIDNAARVIIVAAYYRYNDVSTLFFYLSLENIILVVFWGIIYRNFIGSFNLKKTIPTLKLLLVASAPLLIWAPFEMIQNNLYIYFLEYNGFKNDVGYFSFFNNLSLVVPAGIAGLLNTYMLPRLYEKTKIQSFEAVNRFLLKFVMTYLVLVILSYVLIRFNLVVVLKFISKPEYLSQAKLFDWFFAANLLFNTSLIVTNIFFAYNQQKYLIVVKTFPGLIALISLLIFTPTYGLYCMTWIFLGVSIIQLIILTLSFHKLKQKLI